MISGMFTDESQKKHFDDLRTLRKKKKKERKKNKGYCLRCKPRR